MVADATGNDLCHDSAAEQDEDQGAGKLSQHLSGECLPLQ